MSKSEISRNRATRTRRYVAALAVLMAVGCAAPVDDASNTEEALDPELQAFDPEHMEGVEDMPSEEELSASETSELSEDELAELTEEERSALESGEPDLPELTSSSEAAIGINGFELPFICGQKWLGSTRSYHSPANAIDFNHPKGDFGRRVLAAAGGRVTRSGFIRGRSYGRWIEIGHGNGYATRYAHLSRRSVRLGQRVRRGQVIGRVGNSGGSFGSHLHYELRRYGNPIRPKFHGNAALFWGTRYYHSFNCR